MPKVNAVKERVAHTKKRHVSESDSDSGPDDRNPSPAKKPTPAKTQQAAQKGGPPMDGGEPTWELGQNKKVKVIQKFIENYDGKTHCFDYMCGNTFLSFHLKISGARV